MSDTQPTAGFTTRNLLVIEAERRLKAEHAAAAQLARHSEELASLLAAAITPPEGAAPNPDPRTYLSQVGASFQTARQVAATDTPPIRVIETWLRHLSAIAVNVFDNQHGWYQGEAAGHLRRQLQQLFGRTVPQLLTNLQRGGSTGYVFSISWSLDVLVGNN